MLTVYQENNLAAMTAYQEVKVADLAHSALLCYKSTLLAAVVHISQYIVYIPPTVVLMWQRVIINFIFTFFSRDVDCAP